MKNEIYQDLSVLLKAVIAWLSVFNSENDIDIDEEFASIFKKYGIDVSFGILGPIYTLLDVVCDSKRHRFKSVSDSYSFVDARRDLQLLVDKIEAGEIDELERNSELLDKFKLL